MGAETALQLSKGAEASESGNDMNDCSKLRAGEWVRVKSKIEILKTLDNSGQLEQLPLCRKCFSIAGSALEYLSGPIRPVIHRMVLRDGG